MARVRNLEKRRADILRATLTVLHEQGFCDLRIAEVAKQAGVSAGLVCHHFETKQGLLRAVMNHAVDLYDAKAREILSDPGTEKDKIRAIIRMALGPDQSNATLSAAWLALYYLAGTDEEYRTILRRYQDRNYRTVLTILTQSGNQEEAERKARLLVVLLDGVWLQQAAQSEQFDFDAAQALALDLAESVLG